MSKFQIGDKVSFVSNPTRKGTISSRVERNLWGEIESDTFELYYVALDEMLDTTHILVPGHKLQKVSNFEEGTFSPA